MNTKYDCLFQFNDSFPASASMHCSPDQLIGEHRILGSVLTNEAKYFEIRNDQISAVTITNNITSVQY